MSSLDLHQLALLLERLALDVGRGGDRFVEGAQRRPRDRRPRCRLCARRARKCGICSDGRPVSRASATARSASCDGGAEVPEPLLEVRAQVMEVRPVHAAGRRQAPLHRVEQRLRGRVVALADERGGLRMVDLEQVGLEPVALGDRARLGDHRGRLVVAAVDVVPEREVRAPPHLHQRRDLGRARIGSMRATSAVGRVALRSSS